MAGNYCAFKFLRRSEEEALRTGDDERGLLANVDARSYIHLLNLFKRLLIYSSYFWFKICPCAYGNVRHLLIRKRLMSIWIVAARRRTQIIL